jgi:hypothetical protein
MMRTRGIRCMALYNSYASAEHTSYVSMPN